MREGVGCDIVEKDCNDDGDSIKSEAEDWCSRRMIIQI